MVIGTITTVPPIGEPEDHVFAHPHGQLYDRADYPELFLQLRHTYGGHGDMFRVPDFRKRQPVGGFGDGELFLLEQYWMRIK